LANSAIDAAYKCLTEDHDHTYAIHAVFVVVDDFFRWVNSCYANLSSKLQSSAVRATNVPSSSQQQSAASGKNGEVQTSVSKSDSDYSAGSGAIDEIDSLSSIFSAEWVEHLCVLGKDCDTIADRCIDFAHQTNKIVDESFVSRHGPTINEKANIDNIHEIGKDVLEKADFLKTYSCKCGEVVGEVSAFNVEHLCIATIGKQVS